MPRHLGRGSSPIPEFHSPKNTKQVECKCSNQKKLFGLCKCHSPKNTEQVDSEQVSERQGGENV